MFRILVKEGVPNVEYYSDLTSGSRIKKEMYSRYSITASRITVEEITEAEETQFYLRFNMVIGKKKVADYGFLYKCKAGITRI